MENTQTKRRFTPEEYEVVSERVEVKVEYLDGQIVPKEGLEPLPEWVVDEILSADFSLSTLNFEFPMATFEHHRVIRNISQALAVALDDLPFEVFTQGPEIFISLSGKYRIPDVCVMPEDAEVVLEKEKAVNPRVAIEVLSPSNKGEEFIKKLQDYKSIESLQEYWLIAQDEVCIERFVRQKEGWLSTSYDANAEEITFPSLDISLKTEIVYKNVKLKE